MSIFAIGADHNGVNLKAKIKEFLITQKHNPIDIGPWDNTNSVDYSDYAQLVGNLVKNKDADFGILICGTGVGMAITANKMPTIRCALVHNLITAENSKEHNDSNIIALGSWIKSDNENLEMFKKWFSSKFGEYRHVMRVEKIEKSSSRKIILTTGIFDILHQGHIKLLKWSKHLGDKLIVGINSDNSVQELKVKRNLFNKEDDRKAIISSLSCVDECLIFDNTNPESLIKLFEPNIFVKGGHWTANEIRLRDKIPNNTDVKIFPLYGNYSSTNLIEKMKRE